MKTKTKKILLIILCLLLVLFAGLLVSSLINDYKTYGSARTIINSPIGYIFIFLVLLGIILLFLISIIALRLKENIVDKESAQERRKQKEERKQKPKEIEYFYLSQEGINDVDKDYVRDVYKHEQIVSYVEDEDETQNDIKTIELNQPKDESIIEEKEEIKETTPSINEIVPEFKSFDDENDDENKILKDGESRFYNLTQIDEVMKDYLSPRYNNDITLEEVCIQFRNFCSRNLRLYYDIEDIRRFIAGLSVTKLIILQGMSGTGKTSLAYAFGEFVDNKTVIIPVQPMWKERTDLVGYYNEFTKRFNETQLLYKMYEANYNDELYLTVLDEMNIARIEYYFAEFLSLLEIPNLDGRLLDVVADKWDNDPIKLNEKGQIKLPFNMWFIGTANNDDSTFTISDKVYDRAMVLNLDKKARPFDAPKTDKLKISCEHLTDLFKEAQKEFKMSDRNERRIRKLDEYMIKTFHLTFGNRIMRQIESYVPVLVACGGTETEAIDDILSRKVFRKLESKNPVYVRQMANDICAYLDELFGVDKLPLCKEAIHLIEQNI